MRYAEIRTCIFPNHTHAERRHGRVVPNRSVNAYSCGPEGGGTVIAPSAAMMTGHRHSTRTPGLLGPLKSSGTFDVRTQQRHILRHWPSRGKKGPASVLKKRACAHTKGRRRGTGGEVEEASDSKVVRPADPQKRTRIMNTLKSPRGAMHELPTVFRSIYATT